jgi:hypothetical protein
MSFCVLLCAYVAWGQQTELTRRESGRATAALAQLPAPLTVPSTLELAHLANSNGIYQALRQRTVNGAAFEVKDLTLKRDAAEFLLKSGTVYLYGDVAGATTGAVFVGEGTLHVVPPNAMERKQLKAVMKTEVLEQRFATVVFAFTDGTAAELKKGAGPSATSTASAMEPAQDAQNLFRKVLRYDLEARLLEDAGTPNTGGFFLAEVKGPLFSKRLIYVVDPHGAIAVEPEEVALLTSSDEGFDVTLGFRSATQRRMAQPPQNEAFRISQQTIDATIDKNGRLTATAVTQVEAKQNGVEVLPLQMFPTLRVSGVWGRTARRLTLFRRIRIAMPNLPSS